MFLTLKDEDTGTVQGNDKNSGETLPTANISRHEVVGTERKKNRENMKKRKGELEKLLAVKSLESSRAALAVEKVSDKTKKVKVDSKVRN